MTAAAQAVAAVFVHAVLFAWDRDSDVDPVTGSTSGPYDTWQVVGATLALGVLAYAGGRVRQAGLSAAAISLGFTLAWSVDAATATTDDANLWPIGAVLTLIGTWLWTLFIALVVQRRTREPLRSSSPRSARRAR